MPVARFANGRSAVTADVEIAIEAQGLRIAAPGDERFWMWKEVRRADDGLGQIALRREPDDGARLSVNDQDVPALRAAAPALFDARARNRQGLGLALGLIGGAAALVAAFMIGLPMLAKPLAKAAPASYERQIGELSLAQLDALGKRCTDPVSVQAEAILAARVGRLDAHSARKDRTPIDFRIIDAGFPNAFAMPGGRIVVTDDLLALADHPDEVVGVLAHELAHVEQRHVLANIIRQMGLGALADMVLGGGGLGQTIAVASLSLASMNYDRGDETEADTRGLAMLDAAGYDPGALARFFEKLEQLEGGAFEIPELLSTHPDSVKRAARARALARPDRPPSIGAEEWRVVKSACGLDPDEAPDAVRLERRKPDLAKEGRPAAE